MRHWQHSLQQQALPTLKKVGKFVLISAATCGPAGVSGWAVKSVAHRPLKILLAWALEPALRHLLRKATARWAKPAR